MVDDLLGAVRERLRAPASCGVAGLDRVVADALRPGKLLRPGLVVRSAVAGRGDVLPDTRTDHRVVLAAEAMELLHVATLVHDDIIDGSPVRRGRPSVVAAAGVASAIVVGDLLLARAAVAAAGAAPEGPRTWARALECMARGQLLEGVLGGAPVDAQREYAALKTAELFRASAEIGALAVDADPDVVRAHGEFGLHFGIAFQHLDDLLDVVGDPVRMGKPAGLDAANGVPTAATLALAVPSAHGVAGLVAAELEHAAECLPPGRGSVELLAWAAGALRRTMHAGAEGPGKRTLDQLSTVLDRLDHDIAVRRTREPRPCSSPSAT